jgi:hypothetical protein
MWRWLREWRWEEILRKTQRRRRRYFWGRLARKIYLQWARFMKLSHIYVLSQIPHVHSLPPSLSPHPTLSNLTPESSWSAYLQLKQQHPTAFNSNRLSGSFIPEIHYSRIYHGNGQRWTVGVDLSRIEGDKKAESSNITKWIWRRVVDPKSSRVNTRCSYFNIPFSTTPIG